MVILNLYGINFHAVVLFRPEHDFLFKSASTYCDSLNGEMDTIAMKYIKVHCTVQLQKGVMHLLD